MFTNNKYKIFLKTSDVLLYKKNYKYSNNLKLTENNPVFCQLESFHEINSRLNL